MKKNRKGFTIVELVIVIAAIAILAAVMIPTFAHVITEAKKSSAMQSARNEFELYIVENAKTLTGTEDFYLKTGDYWFEVTDLKFNAEPLANAPENSAYTNTDLTTALPGQNADVQIYAKA